MSRHYRLTPAAQGHVREVCAYIATDNVDAALRVLEAFENAFEQLAVTPEMGHTREDLTARPVKFWRIGAYLIVYDPASSPVNILAVLHGARDVERLLQDI